MIIYAYLGDITITEYTNNENELLVLNKIRGYSTQNHPGTIPIEIGELDPIDVVNGATYTNEIIEMDENVLLNQRLVLQKKLFRNEKTKFLNAYRKIKDAVDLGIESLSESELQTIRTLFALIESKIDGNVYLTTTQVHSHIDEIYSIAHEKIKKYIEKNRRSY